MIKISSRTRSKSKRLKPPSEIEATLKISTNGKDKEETQEQDEPVVVETIEHKSIKVQKVSRQENKSVKAGKRFDALKVRESGFLQSLIVAWSGSATVDTVNIHLDLGKHGSFQVNFTEYFDAGIVASHSAQDFWVSKKDDTAKKYAVALTPAMPIEFESLKVVLTNQNIDDLTIGLAQLKFYYEIEG